MSSALSSASATASATASASGSASNYTASLNVAIDKLEEALENARDMPAWAATLITVVSLLCAIILLHVLAVLSTAPCLYGLWRRRKRNRELLPVDEDASGVDTEETEIIEPTPDAEFGVRTARR